MINIQKMDRFQFAAFLPNGKLLGTIEQVEDGYFYFFSSIKPVDGFLTPYLLRDLADRIDEINEPWNEIVAQGLQKSANQ